jgi:hypothetical protein
MQLSLMTEANAKPNQVPSPRVSAVAVGDEHSPVVIIDNFAPDPQALHALAANGDWRQRGDFYPGRRAETGPAYLASVAPLLQAVLRLVFGVTGKADVQRSYFSLAHTPPEALSLAQRIPHVDAYDPRQVAMIHYLCPPELGGTDFYRHRSTGFERVNQNQRDSYHAALEQDFTRLGQPDPAYISGNSLLFERIGTCEAAYNRAVLFPGNLLHCASLDGVVLPSDTANGRLTIAAFILPIEGS